MFVGDAKYKLTDNAAHQADRYQLLAYATALDVSEGVLVYAMTDEQPAPVELLVAHSTKRLHIRRIDLRGSTTAIGRAVNELVDWIELRSGRS